jgi:hypothetical protein
MRQRSLAMATSLRTPIPVRAPGNGKTKTGRLWTYVRDDRPAGDDTAPAVWFAYSEDRKGEHPRQHLKNFKGALQADAYAGFHHLCGNGWHARCFAPARLLVRSSGVTRQPHINNAIPASILLLIEVMGLARRYDVAARFRGMLSSVLRVHGLKSLSPTAP